MCWLFHSQLSALVPSIFGKRAGEVSPKESACSASKSQAFKDCIIFPVHLILP